MPPSKNKIEKKKTHTIIISDLHLGSLVSQPRKVLKTLKSYNFRKLILLGDVFDNLDFRHLSKDCWELLNFIGKISRDVKVRWVVGNHDQELTHIFGTLMDGRIYETYIWQYKQEKYLAIHGHQFDRFLIDNEFLSNMATQIYNWIQRYDSQEKKLSHWLKRKSKGWLRLTEKVAHSAMIYGKKHSASYVFCGHTHKAVERHNHEIKYFNSGCWTDIPCTYITIDEKDIRIREY